MMKTLVRDGIFLGNYFETTKAYFFFGSRHLDKAGLAHHFPAYQFCFLKQVHGTQVVKGEPTGTAEADGHFTGKPGFALAIQTADCVPILLANNSQVCALHAGWRGVAGGIVAASKEFFLEPAEVAVLGPHIQFDSFEIGNEVRDQLLKAVPHGPALGQFVRAHTDSGKCYFNLAGELKAQLMAQYPEIQIFNGTEDTFTSPAYHSFRRDKSGGRQYSFVVLKPQKFA